MCFYQSYAREMAEANGWQRLATNSAKLVNIIGGYGYRPVLLSMPACVDAACAGIPGVSLYDIDDLEAVVARNRKVRQGEAVKAEGIVEEEIQRFAAWLGSLEVLPTVAALRAHATTLAEEVVAENAGKWESASPRDLERVDAVARAVVNRLLHEPTLQMKTMHDDRVHARMAVIREMFGITVEEGVPVATDALGGPDALDGPEPDDQAQRAMRGAQIHELPRAGARGARSRPAR